MPFIVIPGIKGKLYIPEEAPESMRKHACHDCAVCTLCNDEKCAMCRDQRCCEENYTANYPEAHSGPRRIR